MVLGGNEFMFLLGCVFGWGEGRGGVLVLVLL